MAPPTLDFKSPQELDALLRQISLRLHYINRVSGESDYYWQLAELIAAAGRLAPMADDKEIGAVFGNAYNPSKLSRAERRDLMLAYLRDEMSV